MNTRLLTGNDYPGSLLSGAYIYVRDCAYGNIMMDARNLFPSNWHPQLPRRTPDGKIIMDVLPSRAGCGGVRYYFVDFGLSTREVSEVVGLDGQELAPEMSNHISYDPFKLDIYMLGMAYQRLLMNVGLYTSPVSVCSPILSEA
jgi:hypothetical protein